MLNFTDALKTAEVVMHSGSVPVLEGHAGVGKSQLINSLVSQYEERGISAAVVVIYGSLLKEGELGGIPYQHEKDGVMVNNYTTYYKLKDIEDLSKKYDVVFLFIDELNRSQSEVQQELMQLTLDRRINDFFLPDNTLIIAAINPEDNVDGIDYGVNTMNHALIDRLNFIEMTVDAEQWLKDFAMQEVILGQTEKGAEIVDTMVDADIVEFIASSPELLLVTSGDERIKPSPRSWFKASQAKRTVKELGYGEKELYNSLTGQIGKTATNSFMSFLKNKKHPILGVKEIFTGKPISEEIIEKIENESIPRLAITTKKLLNHLSKKKKNKKEDLQNLLQYMQTISQDNMVGVMTDLIRNHYSVHDEMCDISEEYLNGFLDLQKRIGNL